MPNCHFLDFDINIHGEHAPYTVMAQFAGSVARGIFAQDAHQPQWQEAQLRLGNVAQPPGNDYMTAMGGQLFATLIHGDIHALWARARAAAQEPGAGGLRLRLALQPPAVASLPWECLFDPERRERFAASGRTPLVRFENQERYLGASRPLRTSLPITVLVAAPEDPSGVIQAQQALDVVAHLRAFGNELIAAEVLKGRFSLVDLSRALQESEADILHVITHGEPHGILLWQDDQPTFVNADALRVALERTRHVKFVLLNACLTGQSSDQMPLATVGPQLLRTGLPAVVAMQYDIDNQDAALFAKFLYEELLGGPCPGAIDAAVGYARSNLYMRHPERFTYGTPVLWLNAHDGQIFHLSDAGRQRLAAIPRGGREIEAAPGVQTPVSTPEAGRPAIEDPTTIRPQDIRTWLDQRQADVDRCTHTDAWRLLRFEWQRTTTELIETVRQWELLLASSPASNHDRLCAGTVEQTKQLQHQVQSLAAAVQTAAVQVAAEETPLDATFDRSFDPAA